MPPIKAYADPAVASDSEAFEYEPGALSYRTGTVI